MRHPRSLLLLALLLTSGCAVYPAGGYYAAPPVAVGVGVGYPAYYGGYGYRPWGGYGYRPYGYGYGWRRW